jgi:hypothetical protein
MNVRNRFDEVFAVEMEGWCYGIRNYPGEIFPGLIHAVIREMEPLIRNALEHNHAFDILALAKSLSESARHLVHEKEIVFSLLSHFPNPRELDEDAQYVMAQVIDTVEQAHGNALSRLQKKWDRATGEVQVPSPSASAVRHAA